MKLDSLSGMVLAVSRGLSDALALQLLLRSAEDFFRRTLLWVERGETLLTTANRVELGQGQVGVRVSLPDGVRPIELLAASFSGPNGPVAPVRLGQDSSGSVLEGPKEVMKEGSSLWWSLAVAPVHVDAEIPDALLTNWGHVIQAGAALRAAGGAAGPQFVNPALFDQLAMDWSTGLAEALNLRLRRDSITGSPTASVQGVYV